MGEKYYELTAPQKAIWLTEKYYPNTNVNNVCGTFYTTEKLDFDLFKKSLTIFLKNNDSFKIKLREMNGEIKQYFDDIDQLDFNIINIKNKKEQSALEEKIASEVFTMLDSLLFKIVLFRYPDGHGGFVINSHHIISDSWTNGIVANEVALIYAKLKNKEDYVKEESLSYKTYLASEDAYKNSSKFEKDKAYWEEVFTTIPEVATIPSVKENNTSKEELTANRLLIPIEDTLLSNIKSYCEKNKVSLYNFFMTIFSLYLGRVSGLDEFVIGTPILNRTNFKEKQTTGMFINTLPLKVNLEHEKTFLENLKEISVRSMALLRHQKYSFQYIIEDLRKKEANLPKLYNVLYSYQITKMNENMESLNHTTSWTFNRTISDDLDIHMFEWNENNSIQVAYDYKLNKYDEQDIQNLHARILHVINQILNNETILLKDIEIVTPEEKQQILYKFNNTQMDYPKDKTIVDLFEEQVEKTPDNIAVVFKDQQLTYKELNEKANQLARYLVQNKKIKKNSIIGIMLNRSIEMIIGILATLKCNCTYLPIDPSFPQDRIAYILNDSEIQLVLVSNKTIASLPSPHQALNISSDSLYTGAKLNLELSYSSDNIAYLIYTSGSTGNPKGVMVSHKNLNNFLVGMSKNISFSPEKVMLSVTTISFDIFGLELWGALTNGLKLIVASEEEQTSVESLNLLCIKNHVSMMQTTPSRFKYFLSNKRHLDFLKNLTDIMIGGESLPIELIKSLEVFAKANIYNMYGPTETTIWSTMQKVSSKNNISIGTPIANTSCYVLDKNHMFLPPFTPGELYIGGDGVSLGYRNRDDLNCTKFITTTLDKPISLYRTGDLAYFDNNGNLYHLGRIDFQVKVRGYRIELEEIENKALAYSGITNAVANAVDGTYLVLYYSCQKNINLKEFKEFLLRSLPSYMLPSVFQKVDIFSYTPNGKINRKLLPSVDNTVFRGEPRNDIDLYLVEVLEEMLDCSKINISDSFFSIGGDSLSAIRLATIISNKFHISISAVDILKNQTLSDLSDFINSRLENKNKITVTSVTEENIVSITSSQARIYYSCLKNESSLLYNIAGGLLFSNSLNRKKLEKCFQLLVERHSSLRTRFENKDGNIVQIIEPTIEFKLDFEKAKTNDINSIYTKFVKPFNLSKAPLFRIKLIKLKDRKELLLLDMHHIISDGASLNILLQELCDLYNNQELSDKNLEYKDFAIWEQDQLNSKKAEKDKEFWVNQFQDEIPLLNMPTIYPRPSVQDFEGSNYFAKLDNNIYQKIAQAAKKLNITPYMLLLSVYYILLSNYTSQEDIIVGTPVIGRELPELSNLLGMFVNSLPMRTKIKSEETFMEFTNAVKDMCVQNFAHQSYPFDKLVNELKLKRDTSRNPLFDTMFIYQSDGYPSLNFKRTKTEYFIPNNPISKFDLSLEIVPMNNEYHLRFEYCTKLFDEDFIKRFSSHYISILSAILEDTAIQLKEIDILSLEEKNQILYDFNDTKVDYPADKTIIELFEEQVIKTPDSIAVVFENQKLTYRELNEKANQLARFLISNNAYTGDIISILLDKSLEMMVSILGILKIGGTFLPIDINYPKERIDYMIRDSKSDILLTSENLVNKANDTIQVLTVDLDNNQFSQYAGENLDIAYDVDTLAYIMYTSGSTGNPKGVMVTHKNIVRLVKNSTFVTLGDNEHILQTGSIVFDACTFEIWSALLNGYHLFIMKKEDLLDTYQLEKYLCDHSISTLWLTAPLFNQLCESNPYMFKNVKNLLTGGDVLSPKHINMVRKACPNLTVINGYGPTENTTFSCCFTIDKEYKNSIPIGKPISNSTAYVVSSSGKLCPIGVPGELWVGGDGVSKGYLNNPSLTEEKFIANPFGNGIIYKTGDLVKWLPNGNIEFIGRIDNQVKIRGFRVELNEINKTILDHPCIKEAFTTIKVINDDKHVCSYIIPSSSLDMDELRIYLGNHLPSYMIPSYFVKMKKLPINQNGKVDKSALPTDFKKFKNTTVIEPTTSEEKIFVDLFKKVLNIDRVSVTDSFFEIGGDSLTAMKLQIEAISQNLNISYSDIFNYPTVKELAKSISSHKKHYQNTLQDFSKYDTLLSKNTLNKEILCQSTDVGDVLLTGFTGFLGAHILDNFIKKETGKTYCLIRSRSNMSARERLFNVLHFYFGNQYDHLVDDRIMVIEGDISLPYLGLSKGDYQFLGNHVSTIIHSAALVKHYGIYKNFEAVNVTGTQNIVDLAKKFKIKLLHISTISVSGNNLAEGSNIDNHFEKEMAFNETNFYIGQNLDNLYVRSKFEAEKIVFDAILEGLPACVLRMGNLTSRYSEGKFQQNHYENAFVNRLKSFLQIGVFPRSSLNLYCEFTPIDFCGEAIITIANHFNPDYTVFHLLNEKHVYLDRLFSMFQEIGINIKLLSDTEFANVIEKLLADPDKKHLITGIINDLTTDKKLVYTSDVTIQSDFTKEFLYKAGFEWPYIDINYIRNYFQYLTDIGYFNIDIN